MIAQFLHQNPRILLLVICVIIVSGVSALVLLPRMEDPVLSRRIGVISTSFPGADSQRVESLVTTRIERKLQGIAEINEVRSTSRTGVSGIVIELRDDVYDVDEVWTLVRDQLTDVETELPAGCQPPGFEDLPLKAYAVIVAVKPKQANLGPSILRRLASRLRTRIGNLPGTESVGVFGDPGEEYVAEIQAADLAAMGLTTGAIANQVALGSVTQPAGYLRGVKAELLLDLDSANKSPQDLKQSVIRFGNETVALAELADVRKQRVQPPPQLALVDGQKAIVLGAFVDDSLRVDRWAARCRDTLRDFQEEYAGDVEVDVVFSQDDFITARLQVLLRNLLLGGAAVVGVVWLMMGWRSMLVVGAALPLSALLVLSGMRAMQIPLHQMSITGLIVALGLLIDNGSHLSRAVSGRSARGVGILNSISMFWV